MQAAYDDVLERLKGQSNELLATLGGSPGSVTLGSSDETALSQVSLRHRPSVATPCYVWLNLWHMLSAHAAT
jgi:hypothetical protein